MKTANNLECIKEVLNCFCLKLENIIQASHVIFSYVKKKSNNYFCRCIKYV